MSLKKKKKRKFSLFFVQINLHINFIYRVITFVARVGGSGGGFSRITSGGGVFGGVGRSKTKKEINIFEKNRRKYLTNKKRYSCFDLNFI